MIFCNEHSSICKLRYSFNLNGTFCAFSRNPPPAVVFYWDSKCVFEVAMHTVEHYRIASIAF